MLRFKQFIQETFVPKKIQDRMETELGKQIEKDKNTTITVTLSIDGNRIPGGNCSAIKQDYNLTSVVNNKDGTLTVTGSKYNVSGYLEDYANDYLLDLKYSDEGVGVHD